MPAIPAKSRQISVAHRLSLIFSYAVFGLGMWGLIGWKFLAQYLDSRTIKLVVMAPLASLLYTLTGVALWAFQEKRNGRLNTIGAVAAGLALAGAGFSLIANLFRIQNGLDIAILNAIFAPQAASALFETVVTALCGIFILNAAVLLLQRQNTAGEYLSHVAVSVVGTVGLASLIGYLYSFSPLYFAIESRWVVALPSAIALVCGSLGVLLLHPECGLMPLFVSEDLSGAVARRYLLFGIAVPFIVGAILTFAQRETGISAETSILLFTVAVILMSFVMVYVSGRSLKGTEKALRDSQQRYTRLFNAKINGVAHCRTITDERGKPVNYEIMKVNDTYLRIIGIKREDIEGKLVTDVFPGIEHFPFDYIGNYGKIALKGGELNFEDFFEATKQWLQIFVYQPKYGEFAAIFTDISERKRVEAALRESEYRLKAIVENLAEGLVVVDPDGDILNWNPAALRMHGYERHESELDFLSRVGEIFELTTLEGKFIPFEQWPVNRMLRGEHFRDYEVYVRRKKQDWRRIFSYNGTLIRDDNGKPLLGFLSIRDITERRQAEEAVREGGERLRLAVESANLGTWDLDLTTDTAIRSLRHDEIWGYTEPQPKWGLEIAMRNVVPEDRPMIMDAYERGMKTGLLSHENRVIWPDGSIHWIRAYGRFRYNDEGRPVRVMGIVEDISERKRAEEGLRRREEELRTITGNSPDVIARFDRQLRHIFINPYGEKVYGKPREEIIGKTNADLGMPPDKVTFWTRHFEEVLATGIQRNVEFDFESPNFGHQNFLSTFVPEFNDAGQIQSILAISRDITRLKEVQKSLSDAVREAKRRAEESEEGRRILDALMDNIPEGIMVADEEGNIRSISRYLARISGHEKQEVIGKSYLAVDELLSEPSALLDRRRAGRGGEGKAGTATAVAEAPLALEYPLARALHNGEVTTSEERRVYLHDGSVHTAVLNAAPVRDAGGRIIGAVTSWRDITDRKKAEEAMEASNRELEQFAYVASHDLQEPLRMMASFTELIERRYREHFDERGRKYLNYIVDGASRMQELIQDLLTFSRIGRLDTERRRIDLNDVIDNVMTDLSEKIKETQAEVTRDPLPSLNANASGMGRLFMNLIGNAIKFRKKDVPPKIHVAAQRSGNEWRFSVRDNGIGIDPKYFDKIFVIFQRLHSREEYPGTGMGLAIARKIVENYDGRIWVESKPGEGTTFFFTIPQ